MNLARQRRNSWSLWALCPALVLATAADATAQLVPRAFPQMGVESYSFRSTVMNRDYDISVGFPIGYRADSDATYGALIVTDGNRMFPEIYGVYNGLAGFAEVEEGIERLFVVSIGTPFELGQAAWTRRRVHEFSPPGWHLDDRFGELLLPLCGGERGAPPPEGCVGGAPMFLEFIVRELLPAVQAMYPIDPERLGLYGVSAGGFFASWAIFQELSPFKKYIVSSPAMAYGDGEIFRQEAAYATSHDDLNVEIYMGSGSLEIDDAFIEGMGQIVSGQARLSGLLRSRGYPGIVLHSEIHPGLGHTDSATASLARGVRLLYTAKPR